MTYQNVSYKELLSYSNNNPNRTISLESIEICVTKDASTNSLENLGLKGFNTMNISGILSLLTCINDPLYYSMASISARTQLIIDLTTKLQDQTNELKNTSLSRKRKKISELISAVYNKSTLEEKDYLELFRGISIMCDIQFILIKSAVQDNIEGIVNNGLKGEILFSSDPSNWKSDVPIWITDYYARWVAIPSDISTHKIVATWLSDIEYTGWIIKWPDVDMTKTQLVQELSQYSTWQEKDKKLTKDILSSRLGRTKSIKVFTNWIM
jgi:hypothetical protein